MLHPHGGVAGCVRVRDGLYYGGDLASAAAMVREGEAAAADFCFYRGRIDWQPGQLAGECEMGEWVAGGWDVNPRGSGGGDDSFHGLPSHSGGDAEGGGGEARSWPPPGLMPRLARYAATASDLQLSDGVLGGGGGGGRLRSYKVGAWAHVVSALARGAEEAAGGEAPHPLHDWLRLHPVEAEEARAPGFPLFSVPLSPAFTGRPRRRRRRSCTAAAGATRRARCSLRPGARARIGRQPRSESTGRGESADRTARGERSKITRGSASTKLWPYGVRASGGGGAGERGLGAPWPVPAPCGGGCNS